MKLLCIQQHRSLPMVLALTGAVFAILAPSAHAADAAAEFSGTANPNGDWSYGWSETLTGSFTLHTKDTTFGPLVGWLGERAFDGNPSVTKNTSNSIFTSGSVTWLPNQMLMHPGPAGEYSIVRYTVPTTGTFRVRADFIGQDGGSTDVHVLHNSVPIFDGEREGYGSTVGFSDILDLTAGDTVDIRVGYSTGGFWFDSTGANLVIETVPEPASMFALGAGAFALLRRRRSA